MIPITEKEMLTGINIKLTLIFYYYNLTAKLEDFGVRNGY